MMKKFANYVFIFSLSIVFAVFPLKSASAQTGGYFGIWGGYTISPDVIIEGNSYKADLNVDNALALGLKIGHTPPEAKYIDIEFEYSYLKQDIDRTVLAQVGTNVDTLTGDLEVHNFMFNLTAKYPAGRFHPYIGGGLGLSYVNMSTTATDRTGGAANLASINDDGAFFAWQILAGVEIDIINNLSADIGYRYFYTKPEFDDVEVEIKTSMITIGLKFRF
jgi:opacity protein-like surface antigen